MKKLCLPFIILLALIPSLALAHFMVVQPSAPIVVDRGKSTVTVDVRFAHPFEQGLMDNERPVQFGVMVNGEKTDLLEKLETVETGQYRTYSINYQLKRPGDHIFYVEPAPYWEPAEEKFIIHYTKALVHGFGLEEGWDDLVGFPIEIKPLTRPYGLWAGNVFQGQVLLKGKPVPYAEIEIAYDNKAQISRNASDPFHIQVIKADANGVFTYAMPNEGWWGFAALEEGDEKIMAPDGKRKVVEIGGLIWVHCSALK